MATYRVEVSVLDSYNVPRLLLLENMKVDLGDIGDHDTAIEVLKLVDGAECPYDCDTCRDD